MNGRDREGAETAPLRAGGLEVADAGIPAGDGAVAVGVIDLGGAMAAKDDPRSLSVRGEFAIHLDVSGSAKRTG